MVLPLLLILVATSSEQRPLQLAVPAFTGVNVSPEVATFYSEHFATKLSVAGIGVVTQKQMQALLGLERQKQLLGCTSEAESCLAELSNALGVDAIVQGEVGKFGQSFQLNVKIIDVRTTRQLAILSERVPSEEQVLDVLADAAARMVSDTYAGLGRRPPAEAVDSGGRGVSTRVIAIVPAVVSVGALGASAFFGLRSSSEFSTLKDQSADTQIGLGEARVRADQVEADRNRALLFGGVSLVAAAASAFLFTRAEPPAVTPTVGVSAGSASVGITGRLP